MGLLSLLPALFGCGKSPDKPVGQNPLSVPRKEKTEADFWRWFQKNEERLFNFETNQTRVFADLQKAMATVHPDLTFEFGPKEGGKRDFVISADGLKAAFQAVESLHACAPALPRWTFIKFRPRRDLMDLQMNDATVKPEDLEVAIEADGDKVGMTVFVRGMTEANKEFYTGAAFIMLDQAIGERDMMTKVGFVEVKAFDEPCQYHRVPLRRLAPLFDEFTRR